MISLRQTVNSFVRRVSRRDNGACSREFASSNSNSPDPAAAILSDLGGLVPGLEAAYKDIHSHPELSMQEPTADIAAERLWAWL